MLTGFRVTNFKAFADTGDVQIRPLAFLICPKSSVKTSLPQVLLLLRQTVDSRDVENPLLASGPHVDLGPFTGFVHMHDEGRENELALDLTLEREIRVQVPLD